MPEQMPQNQGEQKLLQVWPRTQGVWSCPEGSPYPLTSMLEGLLHFTLVKALARAQC